MFLYIPKNIFEIQKKIKWMVTTRTSQLQIT